MSPVWTPRGDFLPIETWRLFLRFPAWVPGASVGNNVFSVTDANEGGRRHRHHPPSPPPVHQGTPGVMDEYLKPLPLQIRRDLEVDGIVPRWHLKRASFASKAPPSPVPDRYHAWKVVHEEGIRETPLPRHHLKPRYWTKTVGGIEEVEEHDGRETEVWRPD